MPTEILAGVHDITAYETDDGRRYRAYLVEDPVPTLIDTTRPPGVEGLLEGVEATGITPERVVITHGHPDHIDALDDVVDAFGAAAWLPEQTDAAAFATEPARRYGHGDEVGRFTAVHAPGHAPDLHALIDEDAGIAVMGDAVSGADYRGLPAGYLLPHAWTYTDDLVQAERSLERVLEYDFDAALVYHGSSVLDGAHDVLDAYVNFPGKPGS